MASGSPGQYDPRTFAGMTFHNALEALREGSDTPRAYLERCLEVIEAKEPRIKAFSTLNIEGARQAADESSERWKQNRPLSLIDGMPIGIKDLLETKDMPTEMGCEALKGNFPKRDNAAVWALRQAGAVLIGKTVTAELGGQQPGPTANPFNLERTPGGSSSGSAAAVGAKMIPAAIGSQVGGSIIRPAAFCGNIALKPTQGAINRGERQTTSMSTHGVHAASIEDMWRVAIEIANRAGGDPGQPGLCGPDTAPQPVKPERLVVLETAGWEVTDSASRSGFEEICTHLEAAGIELLRRRNNAIVEELEQAIADASQICSVITFWENRWGWRNLVDQYAEGISDRTKAMLERAEATSLTDYRGALLKREIAQAAHRALANLADATVTLSCPGPAPVWQGDPPNQPLERFATGNPIFNYPSSMLFAPAVTMPLMRVDGLPVGVQFFGQQQEDARMTAFARWALGAISPVVG